MRHQHGKTQHFAGPFAATECLGLQQLMNGDEIAFGFRHLAAFDLQEAVVHPVARHLVGAMGAAGLRDLVFMVREDEVEATAMDIEGLAQMMLRHDRALDVPAGTAMDRPAIEDTIPARLMVFGLLPENEIGGRLLVVLDVDARTGLLLVELAVRQFAIVGH